MAITAEGMAMAISYNWLFLWDYNIMDYTFYFDGVSLVLISERKRAQLCMNWEFHEYLHLQMNFPHYFWDDCD